MERLLRVQQGRSELVEAKENSTAVGTIARLLRVQAQCHKGYVFVRMAAMRACTLGGDKDRIAARCACRCARNVVVVSSFSSHPSSLWACGTGFRQLRGQSLHGGWQPEENEPKAAHDNEKSEVNQGGG